MANENNVVKAFFNEKDFREFDEIEAIIKGAKPSFEDNFEGELINIVVKKKKRSFFLKSAVAAMLFLAVVSFSLFFNKPVSELNIPSVSNEELKEVISAFGGREELRLDEILELAESNKEKIAKNYEDYLKY
ncbi:MAG: hypothetical protein N2445_06710, partial [Acidobacteria bacterium]|nr:hypothetical protein [Acidobacteriota bacterium]